MIQGTLFLVLVDILGIYDLSLDNVFLMLFGGYCSGMGIKQNRLITIGTLLEKMEVCCVCSL